MANIKYTKTELRQQQIRQSQLQRYLPTLQLKKAMIQLEILQVISEIDHLKVQRNTYEDRVRRYQQLLTSPDSDAFFEAVQVIDVKKRFENIAGVEIPVFEGIVFEKPSYALFDTPFWFESGILGIQNLIVTGEKITILSEKRRLLEKELRDVSIRVNLFEKIMIPRTVENIKKIKIFLGDQQLAAVSQAKASKRKILERKEKQ